jgi:hypothetical protein
MIRTLLFLLMTALCVAEADAQIRHVKGIQSVELGAGVSGWGNHYYGSYVRYSSNKSYWKYSAYYETGELHGQGYNSMGLDGAIAYTLFNWREAVYINALGGITCSLDWLNPSLLTYDEVGNTSRKDYSTLKVGAFGGIETEVFLSDKFVITLGWNERLLLKEAFGRNRWYGSGGIRYNF